MLETLYNIINLVFSWFSIVSISIHLPRSFGYIPSFLKGNFYLFFVSVKFIWLQSPYAETDTLSQVVLSSSLEDPSFNMPGIRFFNTIAQVGRIPLHTQSFAAKVALHYSISCHR
jgi:chitin synthase